VSWPSVASLRPCASVFNRQVRDLAAVEARIRKHAKLSFEVPRVAGVVTPDERAKLLDEGGLAVRLMLALLVPPFRRWGGRVFGA
jgi:hypothetical protein